MKRFLIKAAACLAAAGLLVGCGAQSVPTSAPPQDLLRRHSYDLSAMQLQEGGRMAYSGAQTTTGVDVSFHQGVIDWGKVAADGIDFAMIRLGYRGYQTGLLNLDSQYLNNVSGALANDLDVGVYFFSQAITEDEARQEASFVLDYIKAHNITYPVVFDMEDVHETDHRAINLTSDQRTKIANAFCDVIANAGYIPMVYGNGPWLTSQYELEPLQKYDIWLAQYASAPSFVYDFAMWQYTSGGSVAGINKSVDLNLCFKAYGKNT